MTDLRIEKLVCLSTAHITPSSFSLLEQDEFDGLIFYSKVDPADGKCYGGFLFVDCGFYFRKTTRLLTERIEPTQDFNELPIDLQLLVSFADAYGVDWLMFDRDEPRYDGLRTYEEEWENYESRGENSDD